MPYEGVYMPNTGIFYSQFDDIIFAFKMPKCGVYVAKIGFMFQNMAFTLTKNAV